MYRFFSDMKTNRTTKKMVLIGLLQPSKLNKFLQFFGTHLVYFINYQKLYQLTKKLAGLLNGIVRVSEVGTRLG